VELQREIMERFGDEDKAIWINEYGWNAAPDSFPEELLTWERVTEAEQADYTVRGISWARENWPWLGVVNIWYFRQVGDVAPDRPAYYFGLVDPEFNPRLVYWALHEVAQASEWRTAQERGDEPKPEPWLFAVGGLCAVLFLAGGILWFAARK
jgi:hypothetical protein